MWHPHRTSGLTAGIAFIACAMPSASLRAQAPERPDRPWPIPAGAGDRVIAGVTAPSIDTHKLYDLPALIDLAQRTNPETRGAWEAARAAAASIGIVDSTYLPQLSLQAIGGLEHTPLAAPMSVVPAGYFISDTRELIPAIAMKWLLFDFGQRDAKREAAQADSFVANATFTAEHQKLVYTVAQSYFALGAARGKLRAAEKALQTATINQDSAVAKRANGLETVVAVAQAERQTAQARYEVVLAEGTETTARANLVEALGVPANTQLSVTDASELPLPSKPALDVADAIREALTHRPDVIAALGATDSADASLKAEQRSYRPVIELSAQVFQNAGSVRSDGGPYSSINRTGGSILLLFKVPLFDGGERASRISVASSKVRQTEAQLAATRDEVAYQVVKAYNSLITTLAQHSAATAAAQAAHIAYDAALHSYQRGVGAYTDLAAEEKSVAQAEAVVEDARAAAHIGAATLALAMGAMNIDRFKR